MPHQCTKCSKVYPDASEELLKGCECGSKFFYYIREAKLVEMNEEVGKVMEELDRSDMEQIESDIRELTGIKDAADPVILDLESVRVLNPGKFEIDIVNLFNKNRPMIYKLGEGKYIIDIESSMGSGKGKKKDNERRSRFMEIVDRDERERGEKEGMERDREERDKEKGEGDGIEKEGEKGDGTESDSGGGKKAVIGSLGSNGDEGGLAVEGQIGDVEGDVVRTEDERDNGRDDLGDTKMNEGDGDEDKNDKKDEYLDLTDDNEDKKDDEGKRDERELE
ncbi:hypothetical protein CMI38_01385 [Candidatus Pacearchaeota archaeon]|jgi:predicted  nucleic acid-binding Zn-ribbon protein|nr:hypothetical protein [Candidatus Pacearchaeota archaeon]|tara:strand:+ start:1712 stop:2548 length:837 start_codon:yes stop_codon:yes gene_type:complete